MIEIQVSYKTENRPLSSRTVPCLQAGGTLLFSPVPTSIEDVIGVGLFAYGVMQAAGGLVKVIIGVDSL